MPRKPLRIWVTAWLSIYTQCRPHGASTDTVDAKPASNRRQASAVLGLICGWFWSLVSSEKFCNCPARLIWKWAGSMSLLRFSLGYPRTALPCLIFPQIHRTVFIFIFIKNFWIYREDKLPHKKEKPETKQRNNQAAKLKPKASVWVPL